MALKNEDLLIEIEDLLRNIPEIKTISHSLDENYSWFGRISAVIEAWNIVKTVPLNSAIKEIYHPTTLSSSYAVGRIKTLLHEARHDLRMKTVGPVSVALEKGMVFDYFDEIRKVISLASSDILFVDPYLEAEFVSRYLSFCPQGVTIRLLTEKKLNLLLPAVAAFNLQNNGSIKVRSSKGLHDRHIIIDGKSCYQSGASFKDGAKTAPTTLTQISDAFIAVSSTYENLWTNAKLEN